MRPLKAILFDLDGTLLDYDMMRDLLPRYFERLTAYAAHLLPPRTLVEAISRGSEAISANDGTRINADVFAEAFYPLVGIDPEIMEPFFVEFVPQAHDEAPLSHDGEEFIHVVDGELDFISGDTHIRLCQGDSLYFYAQIPHTLRAVGHKNAKAIIVLYPYAN